MKQRNPAPELSQWAISRVAVASVQQHRSVLFLPKGILPHPSAQALTATWLETSSHCIFHFLGQVSFWGSWLYPQKKKSKKEGKNPKTFVAFYIPHRPESEQHSPTFQPFSQCCTVALIPFLEILGQDSSLWLAPLPEGLERSPFLCTVTEHFALGFPGLQCNPKAKHYFKNNNNNNNESIFLAFISRRTEKSPI